MRVVIAGASGLIGSALAPLLLSQGHEVIALVRRDARSANESSWDPATGRVDQALIASADAVVNLAGASIGARRLTASYKREVLGSRIAATTTLARAIATGGGTTALIQGSAMGYYGAAGDTPLTEDAPAGEGFLADVCKQWEAAALEAERSGARVVRIRTGLVLAAHGGFAQRLLPLVRRGLFGGFGKGDAYQSWITLDDAVAAIAMLIASDASGPANLVAPRAATDRQIVAALAHAFGKRPGPRVPAWLLRIAVGEAVDDLLASQNGVPGTLSSQGFEWRHGDLESAARWVVANA